MRASLLAWALATCAAAAAELRDPGPPPPPRAPAEAPEDLPLPVPVLAARRGASPAGMPQPDKVTNRTMGIALKRLASQERIILTTFSLPQRAKDRLNATLLMLRNFCYHLQRQRLLYHTLLLTLDQWSYETARKASVPATLDRAFEWNTSGLDVGKYTQPYLAQKHWWVMRAVENGLHVAFLDADVVVLGDILTSFDDGYDVQGLSDWLDEPDLPGTGLTMRLWDTNPRPCLYVLVKEPRAKQSSELRSMGAARWDGSLKSSLRAPNPCQSTGLFFVRASPLSARFMQAVVRRVMWEAPWQWEQAAWNEVVMGFLFGMGEEEPLRYRVLPVARYANIAVYRARKAKGQHRKTVAVHAGALESGDKIPAFTKLGLWRPQDYQPDQQPATTAQAVAAAATAAAIAAVPAAPVLLASAAAAACWAALYKAPAPSLTKLCAVLPEGDGQCRASGQEHFQGDGGDQREAQPTGAAAGGMMSTAGGGTPPSAAAGAAAATGPAHVIYKPTTPPLVIPPAKAPHKSTLIMLHGLGDRGSGWAFLAQQLAAHLPHTAFVLPNAPARPITLFAGQASTAWFDIPAPQQVDNNQDRQGLQDSLGYVVELLEQQAAAGVPSHRVVVGGFSQGGALALMALRARHRLAGVLSLSAFLPLPHVQPVVSEENAGTPVLMCHGTADSMITLDRAQRSIQDFEGSKANFELKIYSGLAHNVNAEELTDIRSFLKGLLD